MEQVHLRADYSTMNVFAYSFLKNISFPLVYCENTIRTPRNIQSVC